MSAWHWSAVIWGVWFAAFVVLELLAAFDRSPWNTLSWTAWELESKSSVFSVAFLAGLAVLAVHIAFRWPNRSRYQPPQEDEHR